MSDSDREIEELKARLAQLEKKPQIVYAKVAFPPWLAKSLKWSALIFILLFVFAAIAGPHTVGDLAKSEKRHCIYQKGFGNWQGSDGMTLDKYCEAYGNLSALLEDRKEHPENY